MGFERVTAIIQGTKNLTDFSGTISNYETDVFRPIFDEIEKLSGKKYSNTLPKVGGAAESEQEKIDIAFRVVADHIRALSFAIADGIIPSNEGRGYVLRRILRRAVRYGRSLGFHEPFFFKLVDVVAKTMGDIFPEVPVADSRIKDILKREEETFNQTLDIGMSLFQKAVDSVESAPAIFKEDSSLPADYGAEEYEQDASGKLTVFRQGRFKRDEYGNVQKLLNGEVAFKLYDTYGFPLDLTQLLARERGFTVDINEFETLMEEQRERGRKAQKKEKVSVEQGELKAEPTKFLGYEFLETESVVETVLPGKKQGELNIVLDQTPCYAEMGGQVGDHGVLHVPGHDRTEEGQLQIIDTQKRSDIFVHRAKVVDGRAPQPGEAVRVSVDVDRRKMIQGHHTVTHLLHWALHEIVSRDATQKGSYVGADKLTFDFSSAPLTPQQKRDVEKIVNEKIAEDARVWWTEIPYAEARQRKEIQQWFGEKYGDKVRVLQIGGERRKLNGYSMELCGGTHVRSTSEIGPFRIVREEAIAAGIRRIEAVAGKAARNWAIHEAARQGKRFETLKRKKSDVAALPALDDRSETAEMLKVIDARAAHLEKFEADVREWEKKGATASEVQLKTRAAEIAKELATTHVDKGNVVAEVKNADTE